MDDLINYLKKWCVKPEADDQEQRLPEDELEGANFTSTVEHIHNVYTYLHNNCPQSSLKDLFQRTPAVFIEYNRYVVGCISILFQIIVYILSLNNLNLAPRRNEWCSGRFYHLKEVCWSDPTVVFQRYRLLTHAPDSPVQQPKVLAPFYKPLDGMKFFFTKVSSHNFPTCIKCLLNSISCLIYLF